MSETKSSFKPGDRVKVRFEDRPGHIRTPWYIRGKTGIVVGESPGSKKDKAESLGIPIITEDELLARMGKQG